MTKTAATKVTTLHLVAGMTASTNAAVTVVNGVKVYNSTITIASVEKVGHRYLVTGTEGFAQSFPGNLKWTLA